MLSAIKKQVHDYQIWLDIATDIDLTPYKAINRLDIVTFTFIFYATLFGYFLLSSFHPELTLFALILHIVLGVNILKARALVDDSLNKIIIHKPLENQVAQFLNQQYSLFLVSQGKNPLTERQIESLEIHTTKFSKGKLSRSGRGDAIRRFRIAFLKREKMFFTILLAILVTVELFIIF